MLGQNKMKVGMVGVGGFGEYRRERMRETGLFDLVAAYDRSKEALDRCAIDDGAKACKSYEELLNTPNIQAIIISTGAKFHAQQAMMAMEKGLHVFVEKPLCSTPEEIEKMVAVQKRTGRIVGVGHTDHSTESFSLELKRMIESGEIGKVVTFEKTSCHNGGLYINEGDWRSDPANNPGGMLFQCGVHAIHNLLYLFGPITKVGCMMRYDLHTTKTADTAHCIFEFESGLKGSLNAYHVSPYRHTFNIFGTKKNIYSNERFFDEGRISYIQETKLDNQKEPMLPMEYAEKSDCCSNLRSFYKACAVGGEPYPSLRDGVRVLEVVFAAEKAAMSGKIVEVGSI